MRKMYMLLHDVQEDFKKRLALYFLVSLSIRTKILVDDLKDNDFNMHIIVMEAWG